MKTLPFDVARCTGAASDGAECPIRSDCLRYTSPGDPEYQWFMYAPGRELPEAPVGWECDSFIFEEGKCG